VHDLLDATSTLQLDLAPFDLCFFLAGLDCYPEWVLGENDQVAKIVFWLDLIVIPSGCSVRTTKSLKFSDGCQKAEMEQLNFCKVFLAIGLGSVSIELLQVSLSRSLILE